MNSSAEHEDQRIDELLERWEELHEAGRAPTAEQLCRDCPHLTEELRTRIHHLLAIEPFVRSAETLSVEEFPLPERIDAYEVLGEIDRGGMGVVYRCRQENPPREVAVKVIALWRATPSSLARFFREVKILGMLQHPGIAQIYQAGTTNLGFGLQPYFAMELVRGRPLDQFVQAEALDVSARLELLVKVCDAVEHAHQRGVIHRDLKPANILVEPPGQPKVLDFGVARLTGAENEPLTSLHEGLLPIGSLPYMSPEQALGITKELDPRCDVYSLGVVAYQILSGRLPYDCQQGTLFERLRVIREETPLRLGTIHKALRGDLETIVAKAMEKDRELRYRSVAAFSADMLRYLRKEPIQATPVGPIYRLRRWCHRNPLLAAAGGLAMVATLCAAILSVALALQQTRAATKLRSALRQSEELGHELARTNAELVKANSALLATTQENQRKAREAAHLAYGRGIALSRNDPAVAMMWLARSLETGRHAAPELEPAVRQSLAILSLQVARLQSDLPIAKEDLCYLALDAVSQKLLVADHVTAEIRDPISLAAVGPTISLDGAATAVAIAQGGPVAIVGTGVTSHLWNPDTGQTIGEPIEHSGRVITAAFAPNGRVAATADAKGTVHVVDASTGALLYPSLGHDGQVSAVLFSPRDNLLLTVGYDRLARLWDVATGRPVGDTMRHPREIQCAIFAPDGAFFVTGCHDGSIHLWDVATQSLRASAAGHTAEVSALALRRDGRLLASTSWDGTARLWSVSLEGIEPRSVVQHDSAVRDVAFTPSGSLVITGGNDGRIGVWDCETGVRCGSFLRHDGRVTELEVTADGTTVVAATGSSVRSWKLASAGIRFSALPAAEPIERIIAAFHGGNMLAGQVGERIYLWRAMDGPPKILDAVAPHSRLLHLSENGEILVTTQDGDTVNTVMLWNPVDGSVHGPPINVPSTVRAAVCDPVSHQIVLACNDGTAGLWDYTSGEQMSSVNLEQPVMVAALSGENRRALLGGKNGLVYLWDLADESGSVLETYRSAMTAISLQNKDRLALVGSRDHTARLWNTDTRKPLGALLQHADGIKLVAFEPGGRLAATATRSGHVHLWDVPTSVAVTSPIALGEACCIWFEKRGRTFEAGDPEEQRSVRGSAGRGELDADNREGLDVTPPDTPRRLMVVTQSGAVAQIDIPAPLAGDARHVSFAIQQSFGARLLDDGSVATLDSSMGQAGVD